MNDNKYPDPILKTMIKVPLKFKATFENQKYKMIKRVKLLMSQQNKGPFQQLLIVSNVNTRHMKNSQSQYTTHQKSRIKALKETEEKRKYLQEFTAVVNQYYCPSKYAQSKIDNFNEHVYKHIKKLLSSHCPTPLSDAFDKCCVERELQSYSNSPQKMASVKIEQLLNIHSPDQQLKTLISSCHIRLNKRCSVGIHIKSPSDILLNEHSRNSTEMRRSSYTQRIYSSNLGQRKTTIAFANEYDISNPFKNAKQKLFHKLPVHKRIDAMPLTPWKEDENSLE